MTTILVVEDDEFDRYVARRILENEGYDVVFADDWDPRKFPRRVDLALVDVQLGQRALGPVLVRALREDGADYPLLLYSGAPEENLRICAERNGADGYILKGDPDTLTRIVREMLDRVANRGYARRALEISSTCLHTTAIASFSSLS